MREKATASEATRIADQLRRAFDGGAWHGPALLELLQDVDAAVAAARPLAKTHSIWELVLHIAAWDSAGLRRLSGAKCQPSGTANFPPVSTPTEAAWRKAVTETRRTHNTLVKTVAALPDSRLSDRVPGKRYDFYHMLHGIAQHELYHAGQIAILRKAQERLEKLGCEPTARLTRRKVPRRFARLAQIRDHHFLKMTATAATTRAKPAR